MTQWKNAMEVFKLLEKSNCRNCNQPTCLSFAAAVFQGRSELSECPRLAPEIVAMYGSPSRSPTPGTRDQEAALRQLKEKITAIDLAAAAQRAGAVYSLGKLTLKVLGKDFSVDTNGNLYSDIHIHSWIAAPFLQYIIEGKGLPISEKWVPFRELASGQVWSGLFAQRCEKPLKRVADLYTDLFEDIVHLFNGKKVTNHYDADISLVLFPLPRIPLLICYWKPEDGLASSLNLFFDATAEENLPIDSIYALAAGLVRMFEKIALRHGITAQPAQ